MLRGKVCLSLRYSVLQEKYLPRHKCTLAKKDLHVTQVILVAMVIWLTNKKAVVKQILVCPLIKRHKEFILYFLKLTINIHRSYLAFFYIFYRVKYRKNKLCPILTTLQQHTKLTQQNTTLKRTLKIKKAKVEQQLSLVPHKLLVWVFTIYTQPLLHLN